MGYFTIEEVPLHGDAALAVFSLCLSLDFEPRREASWQTESKQVEGHMHVAYTAPEHREYMFSGYPSEPILAEAVAELMPL